MFRFTHYFKDDELEKFKTAMSEISGNNNPTNAAYNFVINCSPPADIKNDCTSKKGS